MNKQLVPDQKTIITLLDVAGSCIVDIIYNHIYDRAIAVHEKTSTGITECYRRALSDYVNESNSPRFYSMLLNSIHHYTRMSTIYNDISYIDCVNFYASLFVPHMYMESLTSEQKVNILTMVLGNVVRGLVDEVIHEHMSCVIDEHNDPTNVEVLQDAVLQILLQERETSYNRFIKAQTDDQGIKPKPKKVTINNKTSSLNKLTDAFKKSVSERMTLKKKNFQLIKKNKDIAKRFTEMKQLLLDQIDSNKTQQQKISELEDKLESLKKQFEANKPAEDPPTLLSDMVDSISYSQSEDEELFSVQYVEA